MYHEFAGTSQGRRGLRPVPVVGCQVLFLVFDQSPRVTCLDWHLLISLWWDLELIALHLRENAHVLFPSNTPNYRAK